jgi:hypothetical protein
MARAEETKVGGPRAICRAAGRRGAKRLIVSQLMFQPPASALIAICCWPAFNCTCWVIVVQFCQPPVEGTAMLP